MRVWRAAPTVMGVGVATGFASVDLARFVPDWPGELISVAIMLVVLVAVFAEPSLSLRLLPQWRSLDHRTDQAPRPSLPIVDQLVLGLVAIWLAWAALAAVWSTNPVRSLSTVGAFVAVFAGAAIVGSRHGHTGLLTMSGVAVSIHSAAAVVLAMATDADQFPGRLALAELEPNHLALLLASTILVTVLWALEHPTRRWGPALTLALVAVLGLLLTGSRTAPVALVVAGLVALIAARRWRLLAAGSVALVMTSVLLLASGLDSYVIALTNRPSSELIDLEGGNGRAEIWPEVLDVVEEHSVTGIGLGLDRERMLQLSSEAELRWSPQHTHNLVLHLALTTGWIGAALSLGALGLAGVEALRRQSPWVASIVALIAIDGIAEPVIRVPQLSWALLIGAVASVSEIDPSRPAEQAPMVPAGLPDSTRPERSRWPTGRILFSAALAAGLAIGLVWQEPWSYPHRFRCRHDVPFDDTGLLLEVDGAASLIRIAGADSEATTAPSRPDGMQFTSGTPVVLLPGGTAPLVRCAGLRSEALTVIVDVAVGDLEAEGPARIFSIASGTSWTDIDLHVGQERDGLTLRLRQSRSYRNDRTFPGVFVDSETHRLLITIEPERVRVWKDGVPIDEWTNMEPIDFGAWAQDRSAAVGNEVDGTRPFVGTVRSVRVFEGQVTTEKPFAD